MYKQIYSNWWQMYVSDIDMLKRNQSIIIGPLVLQWSHDEDEGQ